MARVFAQMRTPKVALAAGVAKTVALIKAPAAQRTVVESIGIYFDGIYVTAQPVQVSIVRIDPVAMGTMSAGAFVLKQPTPDVSTPNTLARYDATAEPTVLAILDEFDVHPQAGHEEYLPLGREIVLAAGEVLAIKCLAAEAVNARGKFVIEE